VLADRSTTGTPAQWGEAAVKCHDDFDADDVVVEVNFGGDMATEVVRSPRTGSRKIVSYAIISRLSTWTLNDPRGRIATQTSSKTRHEKLPLETGA